MKIIRYLFLFSALSVMLCQAQSDLKPWQNPTVTQINRLPARATSISYPNMELAQQANRDASPRKLTLNGVWKFEFAESPARAPKHFYKVDFSDASWNTIPVPSNWELYGYGRPWQRLTPQIWKDKGITIPNIPEDYNPTGSYRKYFKLPKDWKDQQTTLHIGAASSALSVWVNGSYIGYSEDNRLPAEFDITPYIKDDKNLVALQVLQWSDGSYIEDQDHWRMSGITREVYIEAAPKTQIFDFAIRTDLDEDFEDAELQIRPKIRSYDNIDYSNWKLEATLFDTEGKMASDSAMVLNLDKLKNEYYPQIGNRPFENLMKRTVKNPKKWSAETPYLYTLVLALKDDKGSLAEARSTKIGFREIDTKGGEFRVNGVPILLYGVNRHDWDTKTGKAVTKEAMERDAQLMKRLNVNASRSSHYPNPPYWYELCDEYGIYVMDEANIESHALGSLPSNMAEWHTAFMERGIRMVERDKNYPSIVSWSLGNEAGFGPNHAAVSAWIKEYDPTRPIHYEGAQNIYGYNWPKPEPKDRPYTDIISRMYRLTDDMIDLATQPNDDRPIIWCEYAHSQGQSTGDLQGYWDAIRKYKRLVGGFVWDWRDQLITKPNSEGKTLWKFGSDFNQNLDDLLPIQKGLISADGKVKSGGQYAQYVWQRVNTKADSISKGIFIVENRFHRTNLENYQVTWEILEDGTSIKKGTTNAPDIDAGKKGKLKLDLPEIQRKESKRYHLNIYYQLTKDEIWADKGFTIAKEQFQFGFIPEVEVQQKVESSSTVSGNSVKAIAKVNDVQIEVDETIGLLTGYTVNGKNYLKAPLQPNFWRPATDNDRASNMEGRLCVWKEASKTFSAERSRGMQLQTITSETINGEAKITTLLSAIDGKVRIEMSYHLKADGSLKIDYQLTSDPTLPNLPRVGLQTQISADFDNLEWFGRGPLESYADKKTGAFIGLYEESVKDDYTYYVRPQESSNKTDVYFAKMTNTNGNGLLIEADNQAPLSFSAWPFTQDNISKAGRAEDLEFSDTITLNIDHKQMGVGGDNTWNIDARPHEAFRTPAKPYRYSFILKPIE